MTLPVFEPTFVPQICNLFLETGRAQHLLEPLVRNDVTPLGHVGAVGRLQVLGGEVDDDDGGHGEDDPGPDAVGEPAAIGRVLRALIAKPRKGTRVSCMHRW